MNPPLAAPPLSFGIKSNTTEPWVQAKGMDQSADSCIPSWCCSRSAVHSFLLLCKSRFRTENILSRIKKDFEQDKKNSKNYSDREISKTCHKQTCSNTLAPILRRGLKWWRRDPSRHLTQVEPLDQWEVTPLWLGPGRTVMDGGTGAHAWPMQYRKTPASWRTVTAVKSHENHSAYRNDWRRKITHEESFREI